MLVRYCEWTQPRTRPAEMSHHFQPVVQPNTCTSVLDCSEVTSGNAASGPARTLTGRSVTADCANPASGSNHSATMDQRRRLESVMECSDRMTGLKTR